MNEENLLIAGESAFTATFIVPDDWILSGRLRYLNRKTVTVNYSWEDKILQQEYVNLKNGNLRWCDIDIVEEIIDHTKEKKYNA